MKRFLVTLSCLVIGLFVFVSGIDAALDHLAKSAKQSTFVAYDQKGSPQISYRGELAQCRPFNQPSREGSPTSLRRARLIPVSSTWGSHWL